MSDELKFYMEFDSNLLALQKDLDLSIERILYYAGIKGVKSIVKTSMPVVTGRLRASINFLTPKESGNSQPPAKESQPGDSPEGTSNQEDTVIFATNVEYASDVEFGVPGKQGARHFMGNGIQAALTTIQEGAEKILKGEL